MNTHIDSPAIEEMLGPRRNSLLSSRRAWAIAAPFAVLLVAGMSYLSAQAAEPATDEEEVAVLDCATSAFNEQLPAAVSEAPELAQTAVYGCVETLEVRNPPIAELTALVLDSGQVVIAPATSVAD